MLNCIDVSGWNDTGAVEAFIRSNNVKCVMIKVSEGASWRDKAAKHFAAIANELSCEIMFYHYARPDLNRQPKYEVNNFIEAVKDIYEYCALDKPVGMVIDWEDKSIGNEIWLKRFVELLTEEIKGNPVLYISESNVVGASRQLDVSEVGLWVASWGKKSDKLNVKPWEVWAFHQHSTEPLDQSVFNGDEKQLKKYMCYRPAVEYRCGCGKDCTCCSGK